MEEIKLDIAKRITNSHYIMRLTNKLLHSYNKYLSALYSICMKNCYNAYNFDKKKNKTLDTEYRNLITMFNKIDTNAEVDYIVTCDKDDKNSDNRDIMLKMNYIDLIIDRDMEDLERVYTFAFLHLALDVSKYGKENLTVDENNDYNILSKQLRSLKFGLDCDVPDVRRFLVLLLINVLQSIRNNSVKHNFVMYQSKASRYLNQTNTFIDRENFRISIAHVLTHYCNKNISVEFKRNEIAGSL